MRVLGIVALLIALQPAAAHAQSTVYSSLPLSGPAAPQTRSIVRGAQLALNEAGGQAGGQRIRYISLNSATRRSGAWTPARTQRNARRAVRDRSTIAYIGEFNSGASAISMPILNEAGIAQISPSNTAIGLTRGGPGTSRGEPHKYYPTGRRHYFRLLPNDRVQAAAIAAAMRRRGCRRVAAFNDRYVYGRGLGTLTRRAARRRGMRIVAGGTLGRPRTLARRARRARAGCVAYTGITASGAVPLFRALGRALPRARFFGGDGIGESGFTSRVPARVGRRTLITVATPAPSAHPPAGQDFYRRFGDPTPDPYAIYGYEAMRLILDAVSAAGPNRVIRTLHRMPNRSGTIGTYRFDRFGDTTLRTYGIYRVANDSLVYAGVVRAR